MGNNGQVAILAVKLIESKQATTPQEAWEKASTEIFGAGTHGQKKGCPRGALLGLCEEGLVRGIDPGKYTKSQDNKAYALQGLTLLKRDPSLFETPSALWKAIGINKSNNGQMDVMISLWKNNLIVQYAK